MNVDPAGEKMQLVKDPPIPLEAKTLKPPARYRVNAQVRNVIVK